MSLTEKLLGEEKDPSKEYQVVFCGNPENFETLPARLRDFHLFPKDLRGDKVSLCGLVPPPGVELKDCGPRKAFPKNGVVAGPKRTLRICRECETKRRKGESLFCIAVHEYSLQAKTWANKLEYISARTALGAETEFRRARGPQLSRGLLKIIGTAPVVGYFVDDKDGKELSV